MSRTVRSWTWVSCVALLSALAGRGLSAQVTITTSPAGEMRVASDDVAVAKFKMGVSAGGEMERIVKNAPFSAQAVTTTTQVLGDGNRIQQTSEMVLARDSEGRTRREMSIDKIGPWSTETDGRVVFIRDPVSLAIYEIAPDGQHASKRTLSAIREDHFKTEKHDEKHDAEIGAQAKMATEHAAHGTVMYSGQPFEFHTTIIGGPEGSGTEKKETLGEQTVEGVRAQGTRETRTIAAGKIGNERPIEIVSETWYSPDLQMVVQSRHSDPRVGETVYRLTNIVQGEPDASLFQVPAGVTVQEEDRNKDVLRVIKVKKQLDEQQQHP